MKYNYNKVSIGLILGLIVPLLVFLVFFLVNQKKFIQFKDLFVMADIHIKLLSLCIVPNLLLFFLGMWRDKMLFSRGVLAATFIYAIVIFIIKFSM